MANFSLIIVLLLGILGGIICPAVAAEKTAVNSIEIQKMSKSDVNPFAAMESAELDYYKHSFSYALSTLKADQTYEWRSNESFGAIRVGKKFKSKSKATCRTFTETFNIHDAAGGAQGYGCKRDGEDGWCKLREGDMLSCALEPVDGVFEKIYDSAVKAENVTTNRAERTKNSFWNWWPF